MSIITTTPMKIAPSSASGVTVTGGGAFDTYGSWVELIASTANPITIAGWVQVNAKSPQWMVVQFGTGSAGSEVALGSEVLLPVANPGNFRTAFYVLALPIGGIGSGQRVVVRTKGRSSGETLTDFCLAYYENFDSAHVTTRSYTYIPPLTSGVVPGAQITPSGTAWDNSSWVEITSGIGHEICVLGISPWINLNAVKYEVDLGTGGSGSETTIFTQRGTTGARTDYLTHWLPAPYPIAKNTRIATRLRKSDTNTSTVFVQLIILDNTTLLRVHKFPPPTVVM